MTNTFGELLGAEIREARESAGMTQRELAEESFPDPDKTDTFERRIRELESDAPPANPRAKTYQPLCDTLNIDRPTIRAMKAQASNNRAQADTERTELSEDIGPLKDALTDTSGLTRNQLIALAELFGADAPENAQDATLRAFLGQKAEEYVTYRKTIDALDDRVAAIANLKGAALHAADTLNFDEVEMLLSRVDEVETEIAADTKVARARNALMRNKPEQAFQILSAAADSFASIHLMAAAAKRIDYEDILYAHGLRYGGTGMALSERMIRDALNTLTKQEAPQIWAAAQNSLAIALKNQGIRTDGPQGPDLLAQAVTAYRAALEVRTRSKHPVEWATTQNNLGNALQDQGFRTDGPQGANLLADAVTAYRVALEVRTRTKHPVHWAGTQNNLGNALSQQGIRTDGPQGADLLAQAVTVYSKALEVRTRADHPVDWAMTQNNLGNALRNQGNRTDGPQGADLLAAAVTAFRAALEVRTRADHPVQWAMTQGNIAEALLTRAAHDTTTDPRPDLTEALAAVTAALEVYDPIHMSYDYGTATRLRNDIQTALDALP